MRTELSNHLSDLLCELSVLALALSQLFIEGGFVIRSGLILSIRRAEKQTSQLVEPLCNTISAPLTSQCGEQKAPSLLKDPLCVVSPGLELLGLLLGAEVHDLLLGELGILSAQLFQLSLKFLSRQLVKRIGLLSCNLGLKTFDHFLILGDDLVEFALVDEVPGLELGGDAVGLPGDLVVLDALVVQFLVQHEDLLCLVHVRLLRLRDPLALVLHLLSKNGESLLEPLDLDPELVRDLLLLDELLLEAHLLVDDLLLHRRLDALQRHVVVDALRMTLINQL